MIRFENPVSERELYPLRPLPGTERKATFYATPEVLDRLGLSPEHAARLDLRHILRLIREEGA